MNTPHEEGRFNLSAWALRHQALVVFLIALATVFGILAYTRLAQSEDPPFTFRVMVIRTFWPGATARQVQEQVTDRIGRTLQETPAVDFVRSYSRPGESLMFFSMKDSAPVKQVPETWYQVRKKVGDIATTLPPGIQGPFFNDEFGDVYTNIYTHRAAARAGRRQGGLFRRPGPAHLHRDRQHATHAARHLAAATRPGDQLAEQHRAVRHADHHRRPRVRAPHWPVQGRQRACRHADPHQQPLVPPRRHRDDQARLR
jgi:hypothetical protein